MSDESKAWPRKRVIEMDEIRRAGSSKPKEAGRAFRKHELRQRSEAQLNATLDELERYKQAHRNLAGLLEGLVRIHGPLSVPLELLETHCRSGNVELDFDDGGRCIIVRLKEAPPQELPPMPETAPKQSNLTLLREGQNFRDGKVVQEHAGYSAEVVDHLPDLG